MPRTAAGTGLADHVVRAARRPEIGLDDTQHWEKSSYGATAESALNDLVTRTGRGPTSNSDPGGITTRGRTRARA
jgi:hypothetical protein